MKKTLLAVTITGALAMSMPLVAYAATGTPAPTKTSQQTTTAPKVSPTESQSQKAIDDLKKKVESKVTELKDTNRKTLAGFITNIKDKKISVQSDTGTYEVETDADVTTVYKISGTATSEVELDTLKKGDYILVNGPEIGKSVTANAIYLDEHYISKSGKIIEVNSDNFYIKVSTLEKDTYTLDIEKTTTSQLLDIKTLKLGTVGFSKLKEGDNIHFTAKKGSDKAETRFSTIKAIIIPQEYFNK